MLTLAGMTFWGKEFSSAQLISLRTTGEKYGNLQLIISHSWTYSDQYQRLIKLLKARNGFEFRNYSVPKEDPIHRTRSKKQLREAIQRHMAPCSVVIVLAGVYATYSDWIDEEIRLAQSGFRNPKPILAVRPWGNRHISTVVREAADAIVGWNTESLVKTVRRLA